MNGPLDDNDDDDDDVVSAVVVAGVCSFVVVWVLSEVLEGDLLPNTFFFKKFILKWEWWVVSGKRTSFDFYY